MRRLILTLAVLAAAPVAAQEADCADPQSQMDMNWCAHQSWQAADAELNAAYQAAMAVLRAFDAELSPALAGGAQALREGQRAWITYRDKSCEAEGYSMRGGSAEPLVVYGCMARLTRQRAADLRMLVADMGG